MTVENICDNDLIRLYIETENRTYFDKLYERYIPLMYGLCLKYLKNQQDAKDAVVFLYEDLSIKIKKYEITNFRNWLFSVTKFYCFSLLKDKSNEITIDFNVDFMEFDKVDTLLEESEQDEFKIKALNECLSKLPEPQKVCIEAFYYNNKSYVEIVEDTNYNIKSVKSYIQNGRRNLKICLDKKNIDD